MRKIIFLILIFFIWSCQQESNESGLNDNLYNVLIDYQKKNPLPTKENSSTTFYLISKNLKYVYEVYFYQDSTLSITLSPIGVNREEKNLYGIYKDETLKATYIIDNNRISKKFVKKYFQKDLEKFTQKDFVINDAMYPEYIYKMNGKNLILKDSVRGNVHR